MTVLHIIDGELTGSADGATFANVDPWTRETANEVAAAGRAEVDAAVQSARAAFDRGEWRALGAAGRGRVLYRLAALIDENLERLAAADVRDVGKPITLSRQFEIPRAADNLRAAADHARLSASETFPNDLGKHVFVEYPPAGVVASIVPWNVPLMMATGKTAAALAWGNSVVLKPAEISPTSATILGELALEAGMPAGVLNVVHGLGPGAAGQFLVEHPGVDRITFTGETGTGRAIAASAAANLTPLSLELGGKSAHVVFDDVDLDEAVPNAVRASFMNAGQICFSGNRVLVHEAIYDAFLDRFARAAEAMTMGDPTDPATELGPLASEQQFERVRGFLDSVEADSGRVVTGGVGDGWSVRPTIVEGLGTDARIWREEVFGPVAAIRPFASEEEAVAVANDSEYGLSAMVSTRDASRAHRLARALTGGIVWVNTYPFRDPRAPFGGARASGIGREGGTSSRDFYTEPKQVVVETGA